MTDAFCAEVGFSPNYAFEGFGTGITQEPRCSRIVGLVWHKRRSYSQIVLDFIAFTIQYLEGKRRS